MKDSPKVRERILKLHEQINLHSHNYHSLDEPSIEDHEYDALFNELLDLENKFPQYQYSFSPSQRVGGQPLEGFKKKYNDKNDVPRPDHWSGWNLKPTSIEFWLDGDNRIHERLKYTLDENNNWIKNLLSP